MLGTTIDLPPEFGFFLTVDCPVFAHFTNVTHSVCPFEFHISRLKYNCVKNGSIHNGKPKNQCNACGHQFVNDPENVPVSEETKELIDKLLLEKIPLAGIVRVTAVSERWSQNYVNETYENVPKQLVARDKSKGRVTLQCDEM